MQFHNPKEFRQSIRQLCRERSRGGSNEANFMHVQGSTLLLLASYCFIITHHLCCEKSNTIWQLLHKVISKRVCFLFPMHASAVDLNCVLLF